ncbi:6877_t:CDS:2, partial [Acaulospora colombiana]
MGATEAAGTAVAKTSDGRFYSEAPIPVSEVSASQEEPAAAKENSYQANDVSGIDGDVPVTSNDVTVGDALVQEQAHEAHEKGLV